MKIVNDVNIVGDKQDILDLMASANFGNLVKDFLSDWKEYFSDYDEAFLVKLKIESLLKESLD